MYISLSVKSEPVSETGNIQVITEHLPPLQIYEDGKLSGLAIDIVNQLLEKLDRNESIQILPWARAYKLALEQKNILIFSIRRTKDREKSFKWVGQLPYKFPTYFWVLKSRKDIKITNWQEALNYKTALPRAESRITQLLNHGFVIDKNLILTNNLESVLKMLARGRIDFFVGAEQVTLYQLEKIGLNQDLFTTYPENDGILEPLYIAFSINTPDEIVVRFQKAYQELIQMGKIHPIGTQ